MKPISNVFFSVFVITAMSVADSASGHAQTGFLGGLFGGPKVVTISTEQLRDRLVNPKTNELKPAEQRDFVLVDVRTPEEFNVSVIPGAITKAEYEKNPAKYRDKTVIPYCTVGGRSGAYAKSLAADGVKVVNYDGSILAWVQSGLPLVTLDGKPTRRVHTYSNRYTIPSNYQQVTR